MAIVIGTEACEPGSVAGEVHAGLESLYGEEAAASEAVRGVAFAVASGVIEGIRKQIGDGEAVVRDGSNLSGGSGSGSSGAPADATYVVAASHMGLSDARVATNSGSVTVDTSVTGQMKWTVADATTTTKGIVQLATNGGTTGVVQGNDARLSDDRTPIPTAGADTTAIHTTASGEIAGLTEETSPSPEDWLLTESAINSNAKRKTKLGALLRARASTVYELDFTAQGTQVVAADGNVVIDGKTWSAVNVANATTFQIQNGAGLQITAASGSNRTWTGTSNTSPALVIPIENLAAEAARYDLPLRLWSYFTAYSLPNANNTILTGIHSPQADGYSGLVSGVAFVQGSPNAPGLVRGSTVTRTTITLAAVTGANTLVWGAPVASIADMWCGTYSGGWPSIAGGLIQVGHDVSGYGVSLSENDFVRRPGAEVIYSAVTRSTSGAPSFTLARMRITIG